MSPDNDSRKFFFKQTAEYKEISPWKCDFAEEKGGGITYAITASCRVENKISETPILCNRYGKAKQLAIMRLFDDKKR